MMIETHYWLLVSLAAGLFSLSGAAPPPSRRLTLTPESPPRLVELRAPVKYGARLTPLKSPVPGARIPGTATRDPGLEV